MNSVLLALKQFKKHWLRTALTCFLFSVALAAIAVGIAYPFARIEQNYIRYLKKENINTLTFQLTKTQNFEQLSKILPEGTKSYVLNHYRGNLLNNSNNVYNFQKEDLELFGFGLTEGRLPQNENEIALSLNNYEELKQNGIVCMLLGSYNFETEIRRFSTFAEAQQIFKNRDLSGQYIKKLDLTGIVDTGANNQKVEDLKRKAEDENEETAEKAKAALKFYLDNTCYDSVFVFSNDLKVPKNATYLVNLPKDKQGKMQIFNHIRNNYEFMNLNVMFNLNIEYENFEIMEENFGQHFNETVAMGLFAFVFVAPIGLVFLLIAIIMMVSLESISIKSSRDEIGMMRMLGSSNRKVYGISLVRAIFTAAMSFLISIIFAFLLQHFFYGQETLSGYSVMMMLSFMPFLITFIFSMVISIFSSGIAFLRYRKKMPADIMRMERN